MVVGIWEFVGYLRNPHRKNRRVTKRYAGLRSLAPSLERPKLMQTNFEQEDLKGDTYVCRKITLIYIILNKYVNIMFCRDSIHLFGTEITSELL